jgi:hypothetical protein
MRNINVYSTTANSTSTVNSAATTWGELKNELGSLVNDDMKVTVRETRNDLVDNNAILPEGAFTIFLFPGKVKSGK